MPFAASDGKNEGTYTWEERERGKQNGAKYEDGGVVTRKKTEWTGG